MPSRPALPEALITRLRAAAEPVLARFGQAQLVREKGTDGPVSEADLLAHAVLAEGLPRLWPGSQVWSEEGDPSVRGGALWLVDPIDGTRDYLAGRPEFSLSVALTVDGEAVIGAVFNPAVDHLVIGGPGVPVRRLGVAALPPSASPRVLVSRTEHGRGELQGLPGEFEAVPLGSTAWKMALVAAGEADLFVTAQGRHLWDIAAGLILLESARGRVEDSQGQRPSLHRLGERIHGVLAGTASAVDRARPWLRARRSARSGTGQGV